MLRRSFLTAAAAAPALYSARSLAFGAGSSIAPVGQVSTSAWCPSGYQWDGDGCVRTYRELNFGGAYYEWVAAVNSANMALGARPIQRPVYAIGSIDNPWFRAQLQQGDFADLSHLRDLLTYGGAAGASIGLRTRVGAATGAVLGAELGALMWMAYNTGVVIQRIGQYLAPITTPAYVPITYNSNYFNVAAGVATTGFPSGACYIDMMGGGGGGYSFLHELL
jgi:hypothetical protein